VSFTVQLRALAAVDVGNDFACGTSVGGRAWCWGKGTVGQLGSTADSTCFENSTGRIACAIAPKALLRPDVSFAQIAAGDSTACGISSTQQIYCWGDDTFGQIGNGSGGGGATPRLATVGTERFTAITAGAAHACALNLNGRAFCWGNDAVGQLGTNNPSLNSTTPVPVSGPNGVQTSPMRFTSISAGAEHTCAIDVDGVLWCWGRNTNGALGDPGVAGIVPYPNPVVTSQRFIQVSAGRSHTCAVTTLNELYCWGANGSRQATDPTLAIVPLPRLVQSSVRSVASGDEHACAVLLSGTVQCWGANSSLQLGRGETAPTGPTPIPVNLTGTISFASIAAGRRTTCGIDVSGTTWCWGSNVLGTVGNQVQTLYHSTPERVGPLR
jgi:alpha-tubulin suppressor-like RCC1 family protein